MEPTEVMSNQEYTTSRLIIIYRKRSEDFVYGGGEGGDLMGFLGETRGGSVRHSITSPPPHFSGDEMNNDRSLTFSLPRSP